jgi:hypothetical protein
MLTKLVKFTRFEDFAGLTDFFSELRLNDLSDFEDLICVPEIQPG